MLRILALVFTLYWFTWILFLWPAARGYEIRETGQALRQAGFLLASNVYFSTAAVSMLAAYRSRHFPVLFLAVGLTLYWVQYLLAGFGAAVFWIHVAGLVSDVSMIIALTLLAFSCTSDAEFRNGTAPPTVS